NDPDLSPIEFLTAVYRATHLPTVSRIEAARALLPYTNSFPRSQTIPPRCKIIIGGLGPCPPSLGNDCQNHVSPNKAITHNLQPPPHLYTATPPYPLPLVDYSHPPPPSDLAQIKPAINRLRPDLAHLPTPDLHLCPCGHWIAGEYDCCRTLSL